MFKAVPLANASALLMGGLFIICRLLASVSPELLRSLGQSWFHSYDLSELPVANPGLGLTVFGLVTAVGLTWITAYAFALIYNKLLK